MKTLKRSALPPLATAVGICICIVLSACSASNNPVLGRVEADVGGHQVVVTDCYRIFVPGVQSRDGGQQFNACRNAAVTIKDDMLFVNGESYGQLAAGDRVLIENGRATIAPR